jgi:hypothetical protein
MVVAGARAARHRLTASSRRCLRHVRQGAAGHPRHVLLAALTAGLLAGPRWAPAVAVLAVLALALAPDAAVALGAIAMLLLGAGPRSTAARSARCWIARRACGRRCSTTRGPACSGRA